MQREFISTDLFLNKWAALGLNDDDLRKLEYYLLRFPQVGNVISGSGGIRKMRWQLPDRGKRSGARIIYIDFVRFEKIYLLAAYPKNEKIDLTPDDLHEMRILVKYIEEKLKAERGKQNE